MDTYDAHTDPDRGRDEPDPIAIRLPLSTRQALALRHILFVARDNNTNAEQWQKASEANELILAIDQEATYRCAQH